MKLISPTFANYESIPPLYTYDGENISPLLQWEAVPDGTKSLVLVMDDPDALKGIWNHWIIFDLSAQINSLPEGISQCLSNKKHRYFFRLYALDNFLELPSGTTKKQIDQARYIIEEAELVGLYTGPWQEE